MGILSTKRVASLLAAGAGAVALAAAPGSASAACTNITGTGATLQTLAQTAVWIPGTTACAGNITYTGIGSQPGLNRWKADGTAGSPSTDSYIATDDAPSALQISNISTANGGSTVEVIPVLQAAVTVLVNLPSGCSAASSNPLHADPAALQNAYDANTATFNDLFPGGQLTGTCSATIDPIARNSGSGTTQIFKKYLDIASPGNWSGDVTGDATWPAGSVVRATANGGSGMVAAVNSTDGTVGYANLADAQVRGLSETPGANGFWVYLPSAGDPSGWAGPLQDDGFGTLTSNCDSTNYGTVPSTTTNADWSNVFGVSLRPANYGLCGLSYVVALTYRYNRVSGRTFNEGDTVRQYLQYVTNSASGQLDIASHSYAPLPGGIATTAAAGAALVNSN